MLQTECTWNDGFETADITPKWGDFGCLHKGLLQVNIVPKIS